MNQGDLVHEFRVRTLVPIGLRSKGAGFLLGGRFQVVVRLDPNVDCQRFEYRQYIRGIARIQPGRFVGTDRSRSNWRPIGRSREASAAFQIPGGLTRSWTEDGQITPQGVQRFGYRDAGACTTNGLEDRYLPDQRYGHEYHARDTYGLLGSTRPEGLRIRLKIAWQGRIIDTHDDGRILAKRIWAIQADKMIT